MKLPPGTDMRLGLLPGAAAYYVFVAAPPLTPGPHLLSLADKPGSMTALLVHDAGCNWMDRAGMRIAESTLEAGGAVIMQFGTMADALAAHRRLIGLVRVP